MSKVSLCMLDPLDLIMALTKTVLATVMANGKGFGQV